MKTSNDNSVGWIKVRRAPWTLATGRSSGPWTSLWWELLDGSGVSLLTAMIDEVPDLQLQTLTIWLPKTVSGDAAVRVDVRGAEGQRGGARIETVTAGSLSLDIAFRNDHGYGAGGKVTEEFVQLMAASASLIATTVDTDNRPVRFSIPLKGFDAARHAEAIDYEAFSKRREALIVAARERRTFPPTIKTAWWVFQQGQRFEQ